MSSDHKRTYRSESRKAQAQITRARILAAAKKLFQTQGFEKVTIEKLALQSEISAPTIYALFQSKRGVLRAIMDEALPSDEREALVEVAIGEKSPKKRLCIAAKIARVIYDAERTTMALFQGASVLAPEFKELEHEREKRRYQRLEETIEMMVKGGFLSKDLTPCKAHAILWALTGRDLYRMLVIEQSWSSDEYEKWLGEQLIKALLPTSNL